MTREAVVKRERSGSVSPSYEADEADKPFLPVEKRAQRCATLCALLTLAFH
jgi:hypothetical protein